MIIKAPAKINLTLDITGKLENGYHTIDSIMQTVSLYDEVELEKTNDGKVSLQCNKSYLPLNEKNTAYRAARFFLEHTGIQSGLRIHIRKIIPGRAGMGGGSADAAAVLKGMNGLFETGLDTAQLARIGAKVGADVPFCVIGGTCRCSGIGEVTESVSPMPDCTIVVCKPPAGMSTPRAYALVDKFPGQSNMATPRMLTALKNGSLRSISAAVHNRFDEVMKLYPVRMIKKQMLGTGALAAMMTGSGSAVFGIFESPKAAKACAAGLQEQGKVYTVSPVQE